MAKPENPGHGNGNNGNENESANDAAHVVLVATETETQRFEGTATIVVNAGCLLVGKGPLAAFADGEWIRAWVEPLEAPAP